MSDSSTPKDSAAMSPASDGSRVVAWAVVNPSGGTRFLGLTNEDAQRVATASERVVPVCWPTLTDEERVAIEVAAGDYLYHQDPGGRAQHIRQTLLGLLERTK